MNASPTEQPQDQMLWLQKTAQKIQRQIAVSQKVVQTQQQGFKPDDLLRVGKWGRIGSGVAALGAVAAAAVGAVPVALIVSGVAAGVLVGSSITERAAKKSAADLEKNLEFLEKAKPVMQQINQMYKEVRQEIQAAEQKGYMPSLEFKQHVERTQQGLAQSLESQQRMEQEQRARLAIAQDERPGLKTSSSPRLG